MALDTKQKVGVGILGSLVAGLAGAALWGLSQGTKKPQAMGAPSPPRPRKKCGGCGR